MRNIIDRTGEEKTNDFGSKIVIKEYRGSKDVDVYFPKYGWTKYNSDYKEFNNGHIKCPYEPRIFGVGYIGDGIYSTLNNKKAYSTWRFMLQRCYDPKYIQKHPTYKGCRVYDKWHNFQVFSDWFQSNYYEIEGQLMNLDKDILCKGNKIYSPSACVFTPQRINTLFTKCDGSRGNYPVGVYYHRKKYNSHCNINGKRKHLGCFDTPEEAFQVYKKFKEKYIKEIAEEYKNVIPQKLYEAMLRYEVDIDD